MVCYYYRYYSKSTIFWTSPLVNSKDVVDFVMLFTLWASLSATTQQVGKAGRLQILCCQGIAVTYYSFTLEAPAWRDHTSDFISFGVRLGSEALWLLKL